MGATDIIMVIGNVISLLIMFSLFTFFLLFNPLLSVVFLISTFDAFEDIYRAINNNYLVPEWFIPIDIPLEIIVLITGCLLFILSGTYLLMFETPFIFVLLIASIFMVLSSFSDIMEDINRITGENNEVQKEKFKFFTRNQ